MARDLDIIDLWPRKAIRDDASGELAGLSAAMQAVLDEVLEDSDRFTDIFDIERAPDGVVDRQESFVGDGLADQQYTLSGSPYDKKSVEIFIDSVLWTEVASLTTSGPTDTHYTVTLSSRFKATITFGDATNGAIPPNTSNIATTYKLSIGTTDFVDVILCDLGNPFSFTGGLSTADKRRVAGLLVPLYRQKGTCVGVTNAIRALLGFESQCLVISESFPAWQLGTSLLGQNTFLYGDEDDLWGFEVYVNGTMSALDRVNVTEVVNYMKPLEARMTQLIQGSIRTARVSFDAAAIVTSDALIRFDTEV